MPIMGVHHSARPLAALDRYTTTCARLVLFDEPVAQHLLVPFAMIMHNEFVCGFPQPSLDLTTHFKQDPLLVLTIRSGRAFRFGDRGGRFTAFTPLASRVFINSAVNNGSRLRI